MCWIQFSRISLTLNRQLPSNGPREVVSAPADEKYGAQKEWFPAFKVTT
jgi:hypothetical protein